MWVWSLGWEDPLEEEIATHSSILAWEILWTKEPGGLQSTGSQRVRHNRATEHARVSLSPPKPLTYITWTTGVRFLSNCLSAWNLIFEEHWIYLNQPCDLGQLIILYPWASFHHLFCQVGTYLELDAPLKVTLTPKFSSSTCECHILIASSTTLSIPPPQRQLSAQPRVWGDESSLTRHKSFLPFSFLSYLRW